MNPVVSSLASPVVAHGVTLIPADRVSDPCVQAVIKRGGKVRKESKYYSCSADCEALEAMKADGSLEAAKAAGFVKETDYAVSLVPAVGMGATVPGYSDSYAYEVIAISKTGARVTLRRLSTPMDPEWKRDFTPGGFFGHTANDRDQRHVYSHNENGEVVTVSRRADGSYGRPGSKASVSFGVAYEFYDSNF